jgi:hypothetical protein
MKGFLIAALVGVGAGYASLNIAARLLPLEKVDPGAKSTALGAMAVSWAIPAGVAYLVARRFA